MKKRILSGLLLLVMAGATIVGQQKPLTTLFMTNPFQINPALAGTHNYFQVISNNRFQWIGFTDAPITNTLSVYGPVVKYPMGWGASLSYDVTGPISIMSIYGAYGYNYTLNEDMKISAGLTVGMMQYKIDFSKIDFEYVDDPIVLGAKENYYLPDATLGFYFYSSTYYAGLVVSHLLNNKIKVGADPTGDSKLKSHFYLNGGYKYYINREWALEPSLVLKKVFPAPFQLDVNARVWYRNMLWGGISYRSQESLSILLGYVYERKIYVGYSYDAVIMNPMYQHNYGTHELMLGYRFNDIKD